MRKAVLLFSAFLFFCTSLLLGCVITLKQVKVQGMSELVISHVNLEAPVKEALEKVPGGFLVEKPIMQQLDTLPACKHSQRKQEHPLHPLPFLVFVFYIVACRSMRYGTFAVPCSYPLLFCFFLRALFPAHYA